MRFARNLGHSLKTIECCYFLRKKYKHGLTRHTRTKKRLIKQKYNNIEQFDKKGTVSMEMWHQ